MHHLYPVSKGDQLCPLGFHPQVRWPTRCKRCFRDYKDHGNKRSDDITVSSPSLVDSSRTRAQSEKPSGRNWTSTSNLSAPNDKEAPPRTRRPQSWTSTPDLDDDDELVGKGDIEVKMPMPRRRHTVELDAPQVEESFTLKRPPRPVSGSPKAPDTTIARGDSLAERVRKMQMLKKQNSLDREVRTRHSSSMEKEQSPLPRVRNGSTEPVVRRRPPPPNEPADSYEDDVEKLNKEIMQTRHHAGNSNDSVALRRQAFTTNGTGSTAGGDAKLQFRVNELSRQLEDLKYEKLHLTTKVKDLEKSLMTKSSKMVEEELRKKLLAAEQLCEELMDENSEIKREMRGMEDEMDEIADNFREDQANEYTTIKKELEIAVKNCRILSFKLKKSERRIEQIEQEKQASTPAALTSQIKQLEEELKLANNRLQQLEIEAEKTQHNGGGGGGRPMLNMIGKSNSVDGKYSRASLTRGGSQEDPSQLMRDLQDSVEREADVREQLKYAEEEADSLRKKIARMEDENESLMVQLRKMATKSRSKPNRKLSPTSSSRLTVDSSIIDKDEGISDEEDPTELRVLLDLNEQEASQLRRKLDELELENVAMKTQIKELRETPKTPTTVKKSATAKDKEIAELQKKLLDAEKSMDALKKSATKSGASSKADEKKAAQETRALNEKIDALNAEIKNLKSVIGKQENRCMELEKQSADVEAKRKKATAEAKTMEDKLNEHENRVRLLESTKTLGESREKQQKARVAKLEKELETERSERLRWECRVAELNTDLSSLRRKSLTEKATLESDIAKLKAQKDSLPNAIADELRKQNATLAARADDEAKKAADMTARYEHLEEQHVLAKARLTGQTEQLQAANVTIKAKMAAMDTELARFKRDNIDLSRKLLDMQTKCKELECKSSQNAVVEHEKNRLLASLQEKNHQYELLISENEMNKDLSDQLKKETDELKRKLGDFNRVNKVQASLSDQNATLEHEITQLQAKLENAAVAGKSDVATIKLRYEQQVHNLQFELNSQQKQCERFKRDRDSFKQLLEAAKRTIKEQKSNSGRASRASLHSGDEDEKSRLLAMEQKIGNLEDELCESRLEASKLKTELVSEKTVSEIKMSELQSRINECEEERLLGSGRTKMPGMKTKLELSWQKEREDSQRLLQETSTLARDLRQTLIEVERERDKERLENRRRCEQLEKNHEEDADDGRKKITELQCDLLELRDAHAKLRTSNEKLRLERERYERERESFYRRGIEPNLDRRVSNLLQMIDELARLSSDMVQSSKKPPTPTTQRRLSKTNSIDRKEPSPAHDVAGDMGGVLNRLTSATDEIRFLQKSFNEDRERDRMRRNNSMRRAVSIENGVNDGDRPPVSRSSRPVAPNGNLNRKCVSIDQSLMGQTRGKIWRNAGESNSSIQSIDSEFEFGGGGGAGAGGGAGNHVRDSSLDSRLSGGSTQSDLPRHTRKKKRSIMGTLKQLARSSSSKANDTDGSQIGSDSDVSLSNYEHKAHSKANLKERLSDMFKRSASLPRHANEDGRPIDGDSNHSNQAAGAYARNHAPSPSSRPRSSATMRPVQIRSSSASPQPPHVSMAEATYSLKTPTLLKRMNNNKK